MKKTKQRAYIIPHLQKTGGSTLVQHFLKNRNSKFLFFHLGQRGRMGYHGLMRHFEHCNFKEEHDKDVVVMGHHIDEGIISYFEDYEVVLITQLRQPIARFISHFNMVKSNGNFDGDINTFIRKHYNYMSLFYVSRFPALVNDVFGNSQNQCAQILTKFSEIYYLEDAPNCFDKILSIVNASYDAEFTDTRREPSYENHALKTPISKANYSLALPDCMLYDSLRKSKMESDMTDIKSLSPHLWYKSYSNAFFRSKKMSEEKYVLDALDDGFLKSLLKAHLTKPSLDLEILFQIAINHQIEFNQIEAMHNLQYLIEFAIRKQDYAKEMNVNFSSVGSSDLGILIAAIIDVKPKSIKTLRAKEILDIKYRNYDLEIATAKIYMADGNYTDAEESLMNALKLSLTNHLAYSMLAEVYIKLDKKKMAVRCLEKCMDLKPNAVKFRERYIAI